MKSGARIASCVPASKGGRSRRRSNPGGRSRAISGVGEAVVFGPDTFVVRVDGDHMDTDGESLIRGVVVFQWREV